MSQTQSISLTQSAVKAKLSQLAVLYKLRLNTFVVFSSLVGYALLADSYNFISFFLLGLGGFLVSGAANAFNQIIEKDSDALMNRTKSRPLPAEKMTIKEAILWGGLAAVAGLLILSLYFNTVVGLLSAISLITYSFIYTPLKTVHPIAVFVGAIPGALPPMIGAVAASGYLSNTALYLFLIQFIWQFPHFWGIAWVQYDDYKKANIMLLPSSKGKTLGSAINMFVYTLALFPLTVLIYSLGYVHLFGFIVLLIAAVLFIIPSVKLLKNTTDENARKVMFASFLYLPLALVAILLDNLFF
ncbi:MAG: protoheme IX farnesyltransferase [Chitinophagales bacterium]|nr:protoheme IX farnesyltransferase [Chitinophagales bacterium]